MAGFEPGLFGVRRYHGTAPNKNFC